MAENLVKLLRIPFSRIDRTIFVGMEHAKIIEDVFFAACLQVDYRELSNDWLGNSPRLRVPSV